MISVNNIHAAGVDSGVIITTFANFWSWTSISYHSTIQLCHIGVMFGSTVIWHLPDIKLIVSKDAMNSGIWFSTLQSTWCDGLVWAGWGSLWRGDVPVMGAYQLVLQDLLTALNHFSALLWHNTFVRPSLLLAVWKRIIFNNDKEGEVLEFDGLVMDYLQCTCVLAI